MPTKDGDATVTPNQAWTQDGTALVAPVPPFPDLTPRTLPLDNRASGTFTVHRSDYPQGLVIVQTGHEPTAATAVFPVVAVSGDSVQITGDYFVLWPDGLVIWFLTQ